MTDILSMGGDPKLMVMTNFWRSKTPSGNVLMLWILDAWSLNGNQRINSSSQTASSVTFSWHIPLGEQPGADSENFGGTVISDL